MEGVKPPDLSNHFSWDVDFSSHLCVRTQVAAGQFRRIDGGARVAQVACGI